MMAPPVCILYTQDPDLVRRVKAFVRSIAEARHVQDPSRLEVSGEALAIVDNIDVLLRPVRGAFTASPAVASFALPR